MAQNCPYYRLGKCANPNGDHSHDCSWPGRDFNECTVYVLITDPARGMARILGGPLGGERQTRGPGERTELGPASSRVIGIVVAVMGPLLVTILAMPVLTSPSGASSDLASPAVFAMAAGVFFVGVKLFWSGVKRHGQDSRIHTSTSGPPVVGSVHAARAAGAPALADESAARRSLPEVAGMEGTGQAQCRRCGGEALREGDFRKTCREAGLHVGAEGRVSLRLGGLAGDMASVTQALGRQQAEQQARFERIENRKGFRCSGCSAVYCMDCLFRFAPAHPAGGKACPSCGSRLERFV
jgi:hypothetical protein